MVRKQIGKRRKLYGPGVAGSIRELAEKVDRDYSTVKEWMKRDDWPYDIGPWKVKDIKIWMDSYLDKDAVEASKRKKKSDLGPLTKARVEGAIERTLLTKQRRLVEKGKLIDSEEAQAIRLRQIHAVKSALLSLPRSVANAIVGKPKEEVEKIVLDRIENIIRSFAEN